MPTLGGLLKRRRTKDSQTLSKELSSTSSPAAETQTSPANSATKDSSGNDNNNNNTTTSNPSSTPLQNNPSAPVDPQNSSSHAKGQPRQLASPMASAVHQPQPSQNQGQNASGISNILTSHRADRGNNPHQELRAEVRSTKGKYSLDDFTLQRTLGTGSFGRVHLVQSKHNHRFYAIKVLKKAQVVKMKQIEHTNDERRMLSRVRHPFLITLWGTFQDSKNLYMVMDFVEGGELFSLLRKSQVSAISPFLLFCFSVHAC